MICKRIKEEREKLGISQAELGQRVGFSQQAIGKWETEKSEPDTNTILILSEIFGVSPNYLLGRSEDTYKGAINRDKARAKTDPYLSLMENIEFEKLDKLTPEQQKYIADMVNFTIDKFTEKK